MNWATYGVIIIFAAFIILMIINPKLSCFGRKITSPLYPVLRHKKKSQKRIKTQDYGFNLSNDGEKPSARARKSEKRKSCFWNSLRIKNTKRKTTDSSFPMQPTRRNRIPKTVTERALCDRD